MMITSTESNRLRVVSNIGEECKNNVHETEGLKFFGTLERARVLCLFFDS